jgi:copper homeostasis protein (lipoprotein)
MKTTYSLLIIVVILLIAACKISKVRPAAPIPDSHTSQNSLDWEGLYTGSMPCTDCAGIHTKIELQRDLTFRLETRYLGKSGEPEVIKGTFTWNKKGNTIILDGTDKSKVPSYYFVDENKLTQLGINGEKVTGKDADRYNLLRQDAIADRTWKLCILNGKALVLKDSASKEPDILLDGSDRRVHGHGGCNSFHGTYKVSGSKLTFSPMATTRMACPELETESSYMQALENTATFNISDDTLSLYSFNATKLAVFVAVYTR